MENKENPRIRSVSDLLHENFLVPRYQRGYRWGQQEISDLLDDVLQYYKLTQDRANKVSRFYCLQPIVVKKKIWKNDKKEEVKGWELIDGQQRLTTILIILNYLEDVRKLIEKNLDIYFIDFETRENCKQFFLNKTYKSKVDDTNVDFYHISKAYEHIIKWFEKHSNKVEVLKTFLNADHNVSVIWYEAEDATEQSENDTSIDLFTRLNEGKIPLTDAELIKALLLQSDFYPSNEERYIRQRLFEIASEWDEIESTLRDEKMWLFINDSNYQPSSKIELIFKLLSEKWNGYNEQKLIQYDIKQEKPKHLEYLIFDRYLNKIREEHIKSNDANKEHLDPVNVVWKEVKDVYSILCEWYEDHTLFHYIGYLLAIDNKNKGEFIEKALLLKLDKDDFIEHIKKLIATTVLIKKNNEKTGAKKKLHEIEYGKDDNEIRRILLLFNIETLLLHKKENARFPFHLFKKEDITSIEHIHPQNPDNIGVDEERSKVWLGYHLRSLKNLKPANESLRKRILELQKQMNDLLNKYNKEIFEKLFEATLEIYNVVADFKENQLHTLYNLALVDKDTNSSLNNSFFDVKREILKENKTGRYIPICTQRVFSKYYSENTQEMLFWNNEDRESYYKAIEATYNSFVKIIDK